MVEKKKIVVFGACNAILHLRNEKMETKRNEKIETDFNIWLFLYCRRNKMWKLWINQCKKKKKWKNRWKKLYFSFVVCSLDMEIRLMVLCNHSNVIRSIFILSSDIFFFFFYVSDISIGYLIYIFHSIFFPLLFVFKWKRKTEKYNWKRFSKIKWYNEHQHLVYRIHHSFPERMFGSPFHFLLFCNGLDIVWHHLNAGKMQKSCIYSLTSGKTSFSTW